MIVYTAEVDDAARQPAQSGASRLIDVLMLVVMLS